MIESVLKMIVIAIWNLIKRFLPLFKKMTGMDRKSRIYAELLYHGYYNLSESDKSWLTL